MAFSEEYLGTIISQQLPYLNGRLLSQSNLFVWTHESFPVGSRDKNF